MEKGRENTRPSPSRCFLSWDRRACNRLAVGMAGQRFPGRCGGAGGERSRRIKRLPPRSTVIRVSIFFWAIFHVITHHFPAIKIRKFSVERGLSRARRPFAFFPFLNVSWLCRDPVFCPVCYSPSFIIRLQNFTPPSFVSFHHEHTRVPSILVTEFFFPNQISSERQYFGTTATIDRCQ